MKKLCNRLDCQKEFETFHETQTYCCNECQVKNKYNVRKERTKKGHFTTQTKIRDLAVKEFLAEFGLTTNISFPIKRGIEQ